MKATQSILATPKGFRITTPKAPIDTETARLKLLSLHATRELIDLDLADCTNERAKLHLEDAKNSMTMAIYYAEVLQ